MSVIKEDEGGAFGESEGYNMYLHDWYVGMAIKTAADILYEKSRKTIPTPLEIATLAHKLADAMIEVRENASS